MFFSLGYSSKQNNAPKYEISTAKIAHAQDEMNSDCFVANLHGKIGRKALMALLRSFCTLLHFFALYLPVCTEDRQVKLVFKIFIDPSLLSYFIIIIIEKIYYVDDFCLNIAERGCGFTQLRDVLWLTVILRML